MTRSHASERLRHPVWHVAIAALALLTAAGWARDVSALTPTPTSTWTRTPTRTPTTTRTSTRTRTPTRTSTVTSVGCADGTREGFIGVNAFPGIAACAGTWSGHVSNGARLCASGWDVCSDRSPQVKAISFEQATAFAGCFAFNAANDNDQCNPCTGGDGADDMAGVGAACPSALGGQKSCLGSGRIDAACCLDYQSGTACQFKPGVTSGVVCCRGHCGDGMVDPGEPCDDGNASNADACRNDCRPNVCGDGFVNPASEQCDDGNTVNGDGCDSNCTATGCGNGIVTRLEQCDDGN